MSKFNYHSKSSAKRYGGKENEYFFIHQWFDSSKEITPENSHRVILHHSLGIFWAEKIFGEVFINSEGKDVAIRELGEQHCSEDFRCGFIPNLNDYTEHLQDKTCQLEAKIDLFLKNNTLPAEVLDVIYQPLDNTGDKRSLILTCNIWFLRRVMPRLVKNYVFSYDMKNIISPTLIFDNLEYQPFFNGGVNPNKQKKENNKDKPKLTPEMFEEWRKIPKTMPYNPLKPNIWPDDGNLGWPKNPQLID